MPAPRLPLRLALALALAALSAPARASSGLVLPYPPAIGPIEAATYDDDGNRVGDATLLYELRANGHLHLIATTSKTDGPRNLIEAEFEPIAPDGLRVLWERSLSHDEEGRPMVLVEVDHERREARCTPSEPSDAGAVVLPLPEADQVTNTAMSLLFLPIARGQVERVRFQVFLCRGGARFVDFVALRGPRSKGQRSNDVLEVRFGPDLGHVVSWFASVVVPKLRFWFDTAANGDYVGHRMPLYGGGPEVLVVRDGVSAASLQR